MSKYNLTITEEQARTLISALDLYSRIGMGQFEEVEMIYRYDSRKSVNYDGEETVEYDGDKFRELLKECKKLLGHHSNGSYGIYSHQVPDSFRVAWDLKKVIRHRLAWDRRPEGGYTVDFEEPRQSSKLPLACIEKDEVTPLARIEKAGE